MSHLLLQCARVVYTALVKSITLRADPDLIEKARQVAKSERKTLNAAFREWLASYAFRKGDVEACRALMRRLSHIDAGRKFSREEMNER
jgi:predicted transcriptional regulator